MRNICGRFGDRFWRGFAMSLMPCFQREQASAEGMIIASLLAGYGELELEMCACLIKVEGQIDFAIKKIFAKCSAEERIKRARKLLTPDFTKAGLETVLAGALTDIDYCRKIRNQYAHCQWYWTSHEGLCFVNLEDLAQQAAPITAVTDDKCSIDVPLLQAQEAFFNYVKECFKHLQDSYVAWDRNRTGQRRPPFSIFPKPTTITRPPLHN